MDATFFETPAAFRAWLEEHAGSAAELWVGFHRVASGRASISWPQAVDEALCFGWIDGVRKRIDDSSYAIRFTPRKPGSTWSAVNVERVRELSARGLMKPAGIRAFEARSESRTATYSYEQRAAGLDPAFEARFREHPEAWAFWESQPASYRKAASWWVASAKGEETRLRRLSKLIEDSGQGRRIAQLRRPAKRDAGEEGTA